MRKVEADANKKAERKRRRDAKKGIVAEAPEPAFKAKTLEDEPFLGPHLMWVWKAFTDLNYRRPAGFAGPLPITYTDIDAYCRLKDILSPGERERLLRLIDPLDRAWMAKAHEESAKGDKNPSKSAPPSQSPPRGGGTRPPPRTKVS